MVAELTPATRPVVVEALEQRMVTVPSLSAALKIPPEAVISRVRRIAAPFFKDQPTKEELRETHRNYFLWTHDLGAGHNKRFYLPTRLAGRTIDTGLARPDRLAKPLTEDTLPTYYLQLCFYRLKNDGVKRSRMSKRVFEKAFPELVAKHVGSWRYYVEKRSDSWPAERLSYTLLDIEDTELRGLRRRLKREAKRRWALDAFRPLIRGGEFFFTWLTATDSRAEELRGAFSGMQLPGHPTVEVCAVPEAKDVLERN